MEAVMDANEEGWVEREELGHGTEDGGAMTSPLLIPIIKREALIRTSKNYFQRVSKEDLPISNTEAFLRNNALLQNINDLDTKIHESLNDQMSPRFANLQANYWSMVRNMLPIWKKSLDELK
ncbi:hypothetical protein Btru_033157 [Bulinus truncatus]|nr:hypothetical protein Btru_033157 [Bulinus truncatus]